MVVRRSSDVGGQRGCTGDQATMGLHTQNGRQPETDVRKRYGGLRAKLHQPQRFDEKRLAIGQDRRGLSSTGVALLGANANWKSSKRVSIEYF